MRIVIEGLDSRTVEEWKRSAPPDHFTKARPVDFGVIQILEIPKESRKRMHRDAERTANQLMNYRGPLTVRLLDGEEVLEDLSVVGVQQRLARIEQLLTKGKLPRHLLTEGEKSKKGKKAAKTAKKSAKTAKKASGSTKKNTKQKTSGGRKTATEKLLDSVGGDPRDPDYNLAEID